MTSMCCLHAYAGVLQMACGRLLLCRLQGKVAAYNVIIVICACLAGSHGLAHGWSVAWQTPQMLHCDQELELKIFGLLSGKQESSTKQWTTLHH